MLFAISVHTQQDTGKGFTSFRGALIHNPENMIFFAVPNDGPLGIYSGSERILGIGDTRFHSAVVDFALNPVSLNELNQLSIRLTLENGKELIVRADPKKEDLER